MEHVLNFFSDLILFTFGLVVTTFWIFVIVFVIDELLDMFFGDEDKEEDDESS